MLDGAPAGYVPVVSLAEDAVQETRGTQKPDMATMQRRDGSASRNVLMRHQQRRRLFPCARLRQQVFQQVVGKAAITQLRRARRRDGIGQACARLQLGMFQEAAIRPTLKSCRLLFSTAAPLTSRRRPSAAICRYLTDSSSVMRRRRAG